MYVRSISFAENVKEHFMVEWMQNSSKRGWPWHTMPMPAVIQMPFI